MSIVITLGFCVVTAELQHMFIVVAVVAVVVIIVVVVVRCLRCRLHWLIFRCFFLRFFFPRCCFVSVCLRFSCRWLLSNCDFDSVRQAVVDTEFRKTSRKGRERSDLRIESERRMWTNGLKWKKIEMRQEIQSKCVCVCKLSKMERQTAGNNFFALSSNVCTLSKNARAKTETTGATIHTKH